MRSTIIIPNYNGLEYLANCLSALSKEVDVSLDEVIIVDNSSTDNSVRFIESTYPFIKLIVLDKNYGFSSAVNEGIRAANSDYIILLNNDTEVCDGWLNSLIDSIENNPGVFSVSSKMIQCNNKQFIDDAGDGLTLIGWAYKRGDGKPVSQFTKQEQVFSACAGAAIYRKSMLDQIGYFDETFFAYLEDVDIGYRAKIYGFVNLFCPEAKVYHIGSATSGGGEKGINSFKVRLSARNNIYLFYKNMPYIQLILNFPFLLIGIIWKNVSYHRRGYGKDFYEGTIEGIKNCKKIQRVNHRLIYLENYFRIQIDLINDTFKYFIGRFI
ncbi:glycosyltransferase family 2 protein [Bacillus sp. FJAT-28004]|uniref:glycosyltransferase family 2 protein n=1 Tax=Bacillus sp. FJAT-28004 TaxID=1679165 RepID=UPI0006B522D7|nr:glycosyltransferase family 2 protein [Bacillus sp. FJAT-28004]